MRMNRLCALPRSRSRSAAPGAAIRVLQAIARMNIGGPAHHVSTLSGRIDRKRFETLLVYGRLGPGEGSFESLARAEGCRVKVLAGLTPELRPHEDLKALLGLIRVIRAYHPQIVHTHTAKAGFVGRVAAVLSPGPRPIIVHTYHGHAPEGYFGRARSTVYRALERSAGTRQRLPDRRKPRDGGGSRPARSRSARTLPRGAARARSP
jgi:hypothetical protein